MNPLGRIKFMFPKRFNVYLHDTPAKHLFSKSSRAFSHGCIRVRRPAALAEYVLRGSLNGREVKSGTPLIQGRQEKCIFRSLLMFT